MGLYIGTRGQWSHPKVHQWGRVPESRPPPWKSLPELFFLNLEFEVRSLRCFFFVGCFCNVFGFCDELVHVIVLSLTYIHYELTFHCGLWMCFHTNFASSKPASRSCCVSINSFCVVCIHFDELTMLLQTYRRSSSKMYRLRS